MRACWRVTAAASFPLATAGTWCMLAFWAAITHATVQASVSGSLEISLILSGLVGQPAPQSPEGGPGSVVGRTTLRAAALPDDWQGDAGVRVVVSDESGQPLPDVDVLLRLESQSEAGTLLLRTDSAGQAAARGLAEGEWQVDLRREGYMLFTAYLRLEAGADPKVGFSSRQRTGTFWAPLSAVFVPIDLPVTAAVKTGRANPKAARKAQRQALKAARAEEERRRKAQERGTMARVVEDPDAAAEAAEREQRRQREREEREAARAAAAAREAAERANAIADREARRREQERRSGRRAVVVEESVVEPEVSTTDPEAEERAVALGEGPAEQTSAEALLEPSEAPRPMPELVPNPRLLPAGACPECRPGEFAIFTEVTVAAAPDGAAATPCSRSMAAELSSIATEIDEGLDPAHHAFVGSLVESDGNDVRRLLPEAVRERVGSVAEDLSSGERSCVVLALVLPAGAEYIGFRYQAGERGVLAECQLGQECQIGRSRWVETPVVTTTDSVTLVHAVFQNLAPRRSRTARLMVYFRPAPGWLPPN